jgi:zinc protease
VSAVIPALGPERPLTWPPRLVHRLPNGLQVVLVEVGQLPLVRFQLIVRSGEACLSPVRPGLAELTVSLLRSGTARRNRHQIDEDLRRLGASLSTTAEPDFSSIAVRGLSETVEPLLELLAELVRWPVFPAEEFERERRQVLEALRVERVTPAFLASERLRAVLFGSHPYAVIAPREADLQSYRSEDLVEFHRSAYTPVNALLLGVGKFRAGRVIEQVERILGDWHGQAPSAPGEPEAAPRRGRNIHLVHLPGTVQTHIAAGNTIVTRRHPDWIPLSVANALFGGAFHSRLVMNIREQKGYTYSPRSQLHPLRRAGYFRIDAAVRSEVVAATLAEIFYELDRLRAVAPERSEVEEAENYLAGVFSLGLASQRGLLSQLAMVYLHDLPEDYLETYRSRVRAVTPDDVLGVARRWLDSPHLAIVLVGDARLVGDQGALFGELTVWSAQGEPLSRSGGSVG